MGLSNFVNVNITSQTRTPTRVGFGTPLVLGYHQAFPDRVRTYESLTDLAADGIDSTGEGAAIYWTAAAILAQNPRVKQFKVGRRSNVWGQVVKLKPLSATEGTVYTWTIGPLGGTAASFTRTVPAASTIAAELAAMKVLIDAEFSADITTALADTNTTLSLTTDDGATTFVYSGRNPELEMYEVTAAPAGISTDLDAIVAADNDWFGIHLDSSSKAEALVVAAWAEASASPKFFFATNSDSDNGKVGATGTLLKQLKALSYDRTATYVHSKVLPAFLGAAAMGEEFPYDPGTQTGTYHGKTLRGVTVDTPSTTFETEALAQNGNTYTTILGLNVTTGGKTASGEFIDVVIGRDWLVARLKESTFGVITGSRRVPYTNGGVAMLVGAVEGVLRRAQGSLDRPGFLDPEEDPIVTAPLVADVDPADRAARTFPDIGFSAKISGAIHNVTISGTISV